MEAMTLTPEQQQAVASWIAAGDNLSAVQKKLAQEFKLSLTYMDVRFLVDDLNLRLKDPAPKADASAVAKQAEPPAAKKGLLDKAKEKLGLGRTDDEPGELLDEAEDLAGGPGGVSVSVDTVSLIPGAIASGSVTFSDGVTGKWIVDNYGRPGLTDVSKPGYRPNPADAQAFMQQLNAALQKRGF
jgi:hypothetical protein